VLYQSLDDAPRNSLIRGKVKRYACNNFGRISDKDSPKGVKFLLDLKGLFLLMHGWLIQIYFINFVRGLT